MAVDILKQRQIDQYLNQKELEFVELVLQVIQALTGLFPTGAMIDGLMQERGLLWDREKQCYKQVKLHPLFWPAERSAQIGGFARHLPPEMADQLLLPRNITLLMRSDMLALFDAVNRDRADKLDEEVFATALLKALEN